MTCVVVGGGAAGLSGAVALARSRRSVLVVDAGDPRNAPAGHVHNFLTRDGTPPAEIYAAGRAEVTRYGGRGRDRPGHRAEPGRRAFAVQIGGRAVSRAAAAGRDRPARRASRRAWTGRPVGHRRPALPVLPRLGGPDQRIGVLATGPMAVHQALLFRQLSAHVTLLQHTGPALTGEQREQLRRARHRRRRGPVVERIDADARGLTGVRLADGARRGTRRRHRRAAHGRPRRTARPARPHARRGADGRARGRNPHRGRPHRRDHRPRGVGGRQHR